MKKRLAAMVIGIGIAGWLGYKAKQPPCAGAVVAKLNRGTPKVLIRSPQGGEAWHVVTQRQYDAWALTEEVSVCKGHGH